MPRGYRRSSLAACLIQGLRGAVRCHAGACAQLWPVSFDAVVIAHIHIRIGSLTVLRRIDLWCEHFHVQANSQLDGCGSSGDCLDAPCPCVSTHKSVFRTPDHWFLHVLLVLPFVQGLLLAMRGTADNRSLVTCTTCWAAYNTASLARSPVETLRVERLPYYFLSLFGPQVLLFQLGCTN